MKVYKRYADQLDTLLDELQWGNRLQLLQTEVQESLNGGAAAALRQLAKPASISRAGAYFTGERLAGFAVGPVTRRRGVLRRPVYDPTCGAGDLLLRWADDLPMCSDLCETVARWEPLITGQDIFPEFIRVARRRLVLKAIQRGARLGTARTPQVDRMFGGLRPGDARASVRATRALTLAMNPPFTMVSAPKTCEWASGKVSLAAILFERCLIQAAQSTRVVAILPDVLRTGSRYNRWRDSVAKRLRVERVEPYGRFDRHADVDVFIIEGVVTDQKAADVAWWSGGEVSEEHTLGEVAEVSVGAVVPHRHAELGPRAPFATSRSLPSWERVTRITTHRRFQGTKVEPPFVAVRRTSSPGDPQRGVGSIVTVDEPVAVENHLLVLKPRSGTIKSCEFILENLRNPRTREWLNDRIRCRHLTVSSLRELPIWEEIP